MKLVKEILTSVLMIAAIAAVITFAFSLKKPNEKTTPVNDSTAIAPVVTAGKNVATVGPCKTYELTLVDNDKIYMTICETVGGHISTSMVYKPK